jgi:hypothetical protein
VIRDQVIPVSSPGLWLNIFASTFVAAVTFTFVRVLLYNSVWWDQSLVRVYCSCHVVFLAVGAYNNLLHVISFTFNCAGHCYLSVFV